MEEALIALSVYSAKSAVPKCEYASRLKKGMLYRKFLETKEY